MFPSDCAGKVRSNLWDWQDMQPTTGPGAAFYQFCDALEVKEGISASMDGWGLEHALAAWGAYWKDSYLETSKWPVHSRQWGCFDHNCRKVCGTEDIAYVFVRPVTVRKV